MAEKRKTIRNRLILCMQVVLVLLMSAVAAGTLLPEVGDKYYIVILVFAGLLVFGSVMLVFPKVSPFPFAVGVLFASLYAFLTFNAQYLGTPGGNEFLTSFHFVKVMASYQDLSPTIHFIILMSAGLFLITGYLFLSQLHTLQNDFRRLKRGDVEITEVQFVTRKQFLYLFGIFYAVVLVSAVIVVFLRVLQVQTGNVFGNFSWSILMLGVGSAVLLGIFIYRIAWKKRK